jgi:hypothetical protein
MERSVLIGDMGVEREARIDAVAGVDVAARCNALATAEELTVRGGCGSLAPDGGERQAVMGIDEAGKRSTVVLLADMRILGPDGVVCGTGRNPTLRLWPAIFSGEVDVLPSEGRDVGQQIWR